ncbi:MAG: type II toxin-antitoxin system VapC family toxin [Phycisphaerales bacterium]|nr:type II toxin-antitoxin system VapC family toxin [Phycisphaerales bacterium]
MTAFLDTAYLVALLRKRDALHETAVGLRHVFDGPLVTTEAVLLEFMDSMASPPLRPLAIDAFALVLAEARIRVVPLTRALLDDGMALFSQRPDKAWGLTDCLSFVVMRNEGIAAALTADRHFEQAGFTALMRSDANGALPR